MFDFFYSWMWWVQTIGGAALGIGLGFILVTCFNLISAFVAQLVKCGKLIQLEQRNQTLSTQLVELRTANKELIAVNKILRKQYNQMQIQVNQQASNSSDNDF